MGKLKNETTVFSFLILHVRFLHSPFVSQALTAPIHYLTQSHDPIRFYGKQGKWTDEKAYVSFISLVRSTGFPEANGRVVGLSPTVDRGHDVLAGRESSITN